MHAQIYAQLKFVVRYLYNKYIVWATLKQYSSQSLVEIQLHKSSFSCQVNKHVQKVFYCWIHYSHKTALNIPLLRQFHTEKQYPLERPGKTHPFVTFEFYVRDRNFARRPRNTHGLISEAHKRKTLYHPNYKIRLPCCCCKKQRVLHHPPLLPSPRTSSSLNIIFRTVRLHDISGRGRRLIR